MDTFDDVTEYQYSGGEMRRLRQEAGKSREMVAVVIERSVPSIASYEYGTTTPPADVLARIAGALGCDPGSFFTRKPPAT